MPYILPDGMSETFRICQNNVFGRGSLEESNWCFLCACLFVYVLVAKEAKSQTDVLTCLKVQSSSIGFLENCGCVSVLRCPVLVQYVSLGHCELFYLVQADRSCPSSSLHCSDGLRGQPSEMRSPLQIATFFAKRKFWPHCFPIVCFFMFFLLN